MTRHIPTVPAIVRSVEDLATLAAQINAEHEAGDAATRKGLKHYRAAGEALRKAKEACGHGKWLAWLEANVALSQQRASEYMRLAAGWDELPPGGSLALKEALQWIGDGSEPSQEEEDAAEESPQEDSAAEEDRPIEWASDEAGEVDPGERYESPTDKLMREREAGDEWEDSVPDITLPPAEEEAEPDAEEPPAPAARPPASKTPTDPAGIPLRSAAAVQALRTIEELTSLDKELQAICRRVSAAAGRPGGEFLRIACTHHGAAGSGDVKQHRLPDLEQVRVTIQGSTPYCSVCPWCHHKHPGRFERDCKSCRGTGWVTKLAFTQAPAGYQAAVLALQAEDEA